MRIAVISDTHGLLRPQVIETIKSCDAVLHGGDVGTKEVFDRLSAFAPLYMVRGNNDGAWAEALPLSLSFQLGGVSFFMVHDKKDLPADITEADVVVLGHSHQYMEERINGRLYLNPGSCGVRRFRLDITMAVLEAANGRISVRRIDLD